jgi:dethiobiotin synthetase
MSTKPGTVSAHAPRAAALDSRLSQSVFIAGTDTGVGKTWVAVRLLRALVAAGHSAVGFKPVAAGAELTAAGWRNDDALALMAASSTSPAMTYEALNPYCLKRPTSPHLASAEEDIDINIKTIKAVYATISSKFNIVVTEGAGGWLTPLGPLTTMQDVAVALKQPVVLVVGLRLGALNHAQLTAAAIRTAGCTLVGWIANPIDPQFADQAAYIASLQERLSAPLLAIADDNFTRHR